MRALDQNLLSASATQASQYSTSSQLRSQSRDSDEGGFGDVYEKTAARARDDSSSSSSRSASRSASNDDTQTDTKATSTSSAKNAEATGSSSNDQTDAEAPESAGRTDKDPSKVVAELGNLDEQQIEDAAEELGMSAEELAAALQELVEAGKLTEEQSALGSDAADALPDDDVAALFKLLLGQKTGGQGEGVDAANGDEDGEASGDEDGGDGSDSVSADASDSDEIAALLAALGSDANGTRARSEDGSGVTFRFERADGKGTPVEMQIGSAEDGQGLDGAQTNSNIETVTVLDARRYLAPTDTNTSAVLGAVTGDKGWVEAMKAASQAQLGEGLVEKTASEVNTLKIQMHPIDLGTVTATLRLKGEDLVVTMNVETAEAYHQLNSDKDKMVQSLKNQGFSVDQINIQLTTSADKGVQQSAASQQHQNGQQMQQQGDGAAARQQQQDSNNRRQQTNGTGTGFLSEDVVASTGDGDSDSRRAGQLYL